MHGATIKIFKAYLNTDVS